MVSNRLPAAPRTALDVIRELHALLDELAAAIKPPTAEFSRDPGDYPKGAKLLPPGYRVAVKDLGVVAVVGVFGGYLCRRKDGTPVAREFLLPEGKMTRQLDLSTSMNPRR